VLRTRRVPAKSAISLHTVRARVDLNPTAGRPLVKSKVNPNDAFTIESSTHAGSWISVIGIVGEGLGRELDSIVMDRGIGWREQNVYNWWYLT
jgi:hypothetical protein